MVKFFTTMEVLHLAVICAVLFRVNGELIVDAEAEVSIRLNDEADLTCTTSGNRIAVCTFISPNRESFTRTPGLKYPRVTYMTDDPDNSCSMKIGSVKEEDNGEWKCDITTVDDAGNALQGSNLIALTVLKPPRSVSLNVDSSVAVTPEDPKKQIRCTAEGGHPAPTFSWLLGGAPAKVEVLDTITEGTDGFYQEVSYTAKKEDDGKTLECVANSQAYTEEDLAAEINKAKTVLDVQYKPVPAKEEYVFYGLTVGQPFPIRISFRSNPTPTDMRWKMHDGVEVPQGSEDQDGKYTSALPEPGPVDGEDSLYTAMLTINNVVAEDAGTTNTLVMTNQHGTAEIKFKLTLGEKPPTGADLVTDEKAGENSNEDEAGTGPVIAVVIIILIIIIVIAVAVVARAQGLLCFAVKKKTEDEDDKEKAVEKEEGDTESADQNEPPANTETDGDAATPKKSLPARMTSLLSAMKKTVGTSKKSSSPTEAEELKQSEEHVEDVEAEKKDDIVYADLDKSAMTEGNVSVSVENEKTEYAEIKPN